MLEEVTTVLENAKQKKPLGTLIFTVERALVVETFKVPTSTGHKLSEALTKPVTQSVEEEEV